MVVPEPVSLTVLPRFLFANSYMSPNMPAKVFRKFFMVSSASSMTEVWLCGGPGRVEPATPDADDWDAEIECRIVDLLFQPL